MTGDELLLLDGRTGAKRDLVGGKAFGIERMLQLGLPVPPAFVLTTEACRRYLASRRLPDSMWGQVRELIGELMRSTGLGFGDDHAPLLVSVRSGASVSMPGMMDTVLNLGAPSHAGDTRSRFEVQFAKVVARSAPSDPWEQLRLAIGAVFESWYSRRAVAYRREHGIPDESGTAVTVQAMVFGDRDDRSGTGVLFSRDPVTGAPEPYGEWLPRAQGEDVVSGRLDARPLTALAALLPDVHRDLLMAADLLEQDGRDVQDIEFTVESSRLWLLQTRAAKRSPEAAIRHAVRMVTEGLISRREALDRITPAQIEAFLRPRGEFPRDAVVLARGKPASPGIGVGEVVCDVEEALDRTTPMVLVRPTTDPDDTPAMALATAVVTEYGGSTSHAAVVCREMAVPCVVGCGEGTLRALSGRTVTVDGFTGTIYAGAPHMAAAGDGHDPDLATLLVWARAEPGASASALLPELIRDR
ncbi:pyruvate, phosphate dikinase [Frankia gtarii]|uniref:pyruvate, phosphate dikinase n=1 Tax=Frankia gtarii TaxID=2950102 RepID=UPI0021C10AD1|nr:pyruvate, phosphate dikinase [Frankia gtarii]